MYKIKAVSRFLHIHMTNQPMHIYNQNQLIYTRTHTHTHTKLLNVRLWVFLM